MGRGREGEGEIISNDANHHTFITQTNKLCALVRVLTKVVSLVLSLEVRWFAMVTHSGGMCGTSGGVCGC